MLEERLGNHHVGGLKLQGSVRVLKDLTTLRLQCRGLAFVGTMASNWNRLIHELSSTVGLRNRAPMFDFSNNCTGVKDCMNKDYDKEFIYYF